jgi:hypothetical protein
MLGDTQRGRARGVALVVRLRKIIVIYRLLELLSFGGMISRMAKIAVSLVRPASTIL